ncbi:hypothetical protein GJ496_001393 [Pomphorhynchus laevis]|nr:hypothetical protein GJ496_001393 [Pomphorhynchus laevis]
MRKNVITNFFVINTKSLIFVCSIADIDQSTSAKKTKIQLIIVAEVISRDSDWWRSDKFGTTRYSYA